MRVRGTLAVVLSTALLLVGCSKDNEDGEASTKTTTNNKLAGLDGEKFCAEVSKDHITAAIDAPYRTYDAVPLKDFPVPGVTGYECQWEWQNPSGDVRTLKVDALSFEGTLDGSLDVSWNGTLDLLGALAKPIEDLGEEAVSAKLQPLVTVSARRGQWQVTTVSSSQGSAPSASVEALTLVTKDVLAISDN